MFREVEMIHIECYEGRICPGQNGYETDMHREGVTSIECHKQVENFHGKLCYGKGL
jgi:hypothetical protein